MGKFKENDTRINRVGRPKGSSNVATQQVREAFQILVEDNLPNFQTWLNEVAKTKPELALSLTIGIAEFVIPKLQRTTLGMDNPEEDQIWTIDFSN